VPGKYPSQTRIIHLTCISSLGVSTSKPPPIEVEDGEVDDAKLATPNTAVPGNAIPARADTPEAKPTPPPVATTMESKKSEILDRREQIKRENAAKAASLPMPGNLRSDSTRTLILDRGSPSLPSRPDAPFPSRDLIDRHQTRHPDRRDPRESRLPDPRVLDRTGPRPGDRGRDFSSGDRRALDQSPRDFGRPNDRNTGNDRERLRPEPPPQWKGDSGRENLDKTTTNSRRPDSGRLSREAPAPRSSAALMDRGPIVNPERMSLLNAERQEMINPERAALISGEKDSLASDSARWVRDEIRDRGPRGPSPRRSDKDYPEPRRDERRNGPSDAYNSPRGRADEIQPPPAGPRGDRPADRERNMGPDRSSFQPSQSGPRSMDPDHGRLNSGPRSQPDPNFGRLNPVSSPEIPLGPRDRNSRGTRPGNPTSTPRRDGKPEIPRPPTPDKQPPTGPARHPRRGASGQFDQTAIAVGAGTTSPASAIHPDRLAQLGSSAPQTPQQPSPAAQVPTPPIHPDRMRAFGNETSSKPLPPNPQSGNNRSRQQLPSVSTSNPPLGPKGAQSSPITPSVNGFTAPTGPASASDRASRGGRRQLAGINTTLQQAGQQMSTPDRMLNTRGRGRLSSGIGPETPISGPPTPVIPPPPPPGLPPARHDILRDGSRELINPERIDLITGGAPLADDRERDRNGRRERSGRHSRRGSRSPARERESKHALPDERAQRNEYRERSDRRTGEPDRERHRGGTPTKDLIGSREGVSRDGGRDREHRDRESSRRDGRDREAARDPNDANWTGDRGGERGGRSRDVRGEERRDSRGNREDGGSGRKRRSDEGALDSRGHEKRARR
jgi:THO complex subunit 2